MLPSKTHYNVKACCLQEYMLRKPPSKQWDIIITHTEELQDSEGGCKVLECHISHHKAAGMSWCSQANIRRRKGKMWWIIEICINRVVHQPFDGNMVTSKGEPIFAHVNMHGFRWKFMAPSSSRTWNSVMKIAERLSLKILLSPNTNLKYD